MAERPGFMVYFDTLEPVMDMGDKVLAEILQAMYNYSRYGKVPELDGVARIAWGYICPKLDADAKKYEETVKKNTYNSYCAKERKAGRIPMEQEEWEEHIYQRHRPTPTGTDRLRPTPTGTDRYPTTTKTINPTINSTTAPTPKGKGEVQGEGEPAKEKDFNARRNEKIAAVMQAYPSNKGDST